MPIDPISAMIAFASLGLQAKQAFGGSGGNDYERVPTMTGRQKGLQNKIIGNIDQMLGPQGAYGQGMGILQQYLDPNSEIYRNFEQPYLQQFEQQTLPGIAERYAGAGALSSSGFGQALGAAGANLQTDLAQMKSGMQRNAIGDIFGQFNQLMNPAFQSQFAYQQQGPNAGGGFAQGLMNMNPMAYSGYGQNRSTPSNAQVTPNASNPYSSQINRLGPLPNRTF